MTLFSIPKANPGSDVPSELTAQELADLGPAKRITIVYEKTIAYLKNDNEFLRSTLNDFRAENTKLLLAEKECTDIRVRLGECRRSKLDMFITFAMGSFLVAIGGGLVGAYPASAELTPWQHTAGWFCIILGSLFPFLTRLLIQFVLRHLPEVSEEWMK
jgi:hypothetical protein